MMERTTTWTNIGTNVDMCTTIDDVLETANLDYIVERQKIFLADGTVIEDKYANVNTKTGDVLGIVGKNYRICQNKDAFNFVNNINDKVTFVKAGQTASGMVYVIARVDDVNVLGDTVTPYIIFQNGHNGNFSLRTTICPLRIVCQNQFSMAFKESPNTITIQHCNSMEGRMKEASYLMHNVTNYMQTFKLNAEQLAKVKIMNPNDIIDKFFKKSIKIGETSDRQLNNIQTKIDSLTSIYNNTDDNQNFKGTAWGMLNAYTDFLTHSLPMRNTNTSEENKFVSVTFDPRLIKEYMNFVLNYAQ